MMLSTVSWTGGGPDNLWSDAKNWSSNSVPGAAADVILGSGATVTAVDSVTINSLQVQTGASLSDEGGMTISNGLTNSGTLDLASANLTVSGGLTNHGTLQMGGQDGQTLTVSSGTFLNAGTFTYNGGDYDGYIVAAIQNTGTFHVIGGFLYVNVTGTSGNLQPVASSYTFTNTGTIQVDAMDCCQLGGISSPAALGTSITGTGWLSITTDTWTLSSDYSLPTTTATLCFRNSSVTGAGKLIVPASDSLGIFNSTISVGVNVLAEGAVGLWGGTISGDVTVASGASLQMGFLSSSMDAQYPDDAPPSSTTFLFTINGSVANDGAIDLYNSCSGGTLTVNGTLTNNSDGTVHTLVGFETTGAGNLLNAVIDNQGTLDVTSSDLAINQGTGTSANTLTNEAKGMIDVGTGQTLTIGGASVIDNGTIEIGGTATVDFSAPTVTIDGKGTLQGQSTSTVDISGSLLGNTTNVAGFSQPGTVLLDGNGTAIAPQRLELMEQDQGDVPAGYANPLAYGTLQLGGGTYVELINQFQNSPSSGSKAEAGYANSLVVPAGSTFDYDGLNFYAHQTTIAGTLLDVPTTTTIISDHPTGSVYGTSVTFTATVSASIGSTEPTAGSVEFYDGSRDLGAGARGSSSGTTPTWTMTTGVKTFNVTVGDTISATYTAGTGFAESSGTTTQTVTARPITVTAVTSTKVYDGTTSSTATPTITSGSLTTGDTAAFAESYDNASIGTGKTLTPVGTVNDGNSGDNYAVTFVTNTTGTIISATSTNLMVTETSSSTVASGHDVVYTITLKNLGSIVAQSVVVSDDLSASGLSFVSDPVPAGFTASTPAVGSTGKVTFSAVSFAAGASATFTIVACVSSTAGSNASVSNTVTLSSGTPLTGRSVTTASVQAQVNAAGASLVASSLGTRQTDLVVTGTAGSDHIWVLPTTGNQLLVIEDGRVFGPFAAPTGRIVVYSGNGNDTVYVSPVLTQSCWIFGGTGNDTFYADSGNSVLVGGSGCCNVLRSGRGRNILIGGGRSIIVGTLGDNVEISGSTAYDTNEAALATILAEWSSGDSYAMRVGRLNGTITGGLNGSSVLNASTIHHGTRCDYLFGENGRNTYFACQAGAALSSDYIFAQKSWEQITSI
jgi:hypothetical protein